jgi:hypothetical protein
MKKSIRLFWQILIFHLLYVPYLILNGAVIVKWLGCGCQPHFNANDFTMLFWGLAAIAVVIISLIKMRHIADWYKRIAYIVLLAACSIFTAFLFYTSMLWK